MIIYFANRAMDILGSASTSLPNGVRLTDDKKTEEIDTGVATFECIIPYTDETMDSAKESTSAGNFILRQNDSEKEFYTIIDREIDTKEQEISIYAEDAGLDLLNEIALIRSNEDAYNIGQYINYYIADTGFEIGIDESDSTITKVLSWSSESTVTERLLDIAKEFDMELSFSFDIERMTVTHKYLNIHQKRGKDVGANLRLGEQVDNITVKESVADLCTGLLVTGSTPDGSDIPVTLDGYTYDDGDIYVDGHYLYSRNARETWNRITDTTHGINTGYIVKTFTYDTVSQEELFKQALAELKKNCNPSINYEADIVDFPEGIKIGDTINLIDEKGKLYLQTRILKLETSIANKTSTATLGDYILKDSGISAQVSQLSDEFRKLSKSRTLYTWTAYADDSNGTGISLDSTNKAYLGISTNHISADVDISDASVFSWTKIKGDAGAKGDKGDKGDTGATGAKGDTGADGEDTSNLVKNGLGEYLDDTFFSNYTYTRGDVPTDSGAWGYFTSKDWTFGTQQIDFDASLTYNISFYARLHDGTASAEGYFSINPRDVDDKLVSPMCVPWYNKNKFYLAEDLKKGDTTVKFKDLTGWNTGTTAANQRSLLFYGYADSTGYIYPDFTYSQNYYNGVYADNSSVDLTNNTITLKTAWTGKEINAGTAVSQTSGSDSYCYYGLAGALTSTNWKRYTGTMKADDTTSGMRLKYAKSFRVGLLANANIDWCGIRIEKVSQVTSDAKSTADSAQSTADSAKTSADNAQSTANTANSNAQSAQQSANQANSAVSNLETTLTKEIQETTEGWQAVFKRVGMYDADAENPSNPEDPESSTSTKVSISEDGLIVEGNSGTDSIKTTVKNGLYGTNKSGDDIFHLDQQGVHTGRAYLDNGYECVGLKMVPITVDGVNYLIYIRSGGTA